MYRGNAYNIFHVTKFVKSSKLDKLNCIMHLKFAVHKMTTHMSNINNTNAVRVNCAMILPHHYVEYIFGVV